MVLDHLLSHLSQLGRAVCKMRIRFLRFIFSCLLPPFTILNAPRDRDIWGIDRENTQMFSIATSSQPPPPPACHMEQIMLSTLHKLKSVSFYKIKICLHSFTISSKRKPSKGKRVHFRIGDDPPTLLPPCPPSTVGTKVSNSTFFFHFDRFPLDI